MCNTVPRLSTQSAVQFKGLKGRKDLVGFQGKARTVATVKNFAWCPWFSSAFFFFFLSPPFFWPQCARRPLSLLSSPAISSFATEGNPTTVHSHRWQTAIFRPRLDRRKLRRQLWKKFFSNSSRLPNSFNFVPYNASLVNTDWIFPPLSLSLLYLWFRARRPAKCGCKCTAEGKLL